MSATVAPHRLAAEAPSARRIAVVRAALAFAWAAALVLAVGDAVPTTASDLPTAAATLLSTYPLIDAVASALSPGRVAHINAAVSLAAAVAVGLAAFGSDAGATLAAFGAWAAVSGALQLTVALHRRARGRQLPLVVSGALSTVAGLSFVAAAGEDDAHLAMLAGYMTFGAVLFLVWAARARTAG
ncbi:hypothetical protein [Conexibacter sp. SYSU D00693]|uniref:hypothetical protein n=1 Tax=Conexibacter sp. SYSU D00693 TaxID=2812560 RepID=UPI00196A1F46|nr:hypothetical protein [Conexibacter sp. SYSU D00693]